MSNFTIDAVIDRQWNLLGKLLGMKTVLDGEEESPIYDLMVWENFWKIHAPVEKSTFLGKVRVCVACEQIFPCDEMRKGRQL